MSGRATTRALPWALISIALLALAPSRTLAQASSTVVVGEGDTCESIAERLYGQGPRGLAVLHDANPELGPLPHHLVVGQTLHAPSPATLGAVERTVERRAPTDDAFVPAHAGDALAREAQVRTDEASSAEIVFRDGASVTVRERTLVIVYGGRRRLVRHAWAHAELERGALRSRLGELAAGTPVEIETPTSAASLAGGVVSVEEDGTSRIANHGTRAATVTVDGARVTLPADSGLVVTPRTGASRPRRLLAAPRWVADQRGFVLGFVGRGATLRGGFTPVEGAAGYRVEVARDPEGRDLVHTASLPADATAFEASGIVDPVVYVSVASIDQDALEGRRSPWRAFSVRLARLVGPGGVDAALPEDGAPRVLPGTWLVAPRGLTCAMDEGPRTEIVTLSGRGPSVVVCGDASGAGDTSPLAVELAPPEVALEGTLVRDRSATLALTLEGTPMPPPHTLVIEAPAGFVVGRVRATGEGLRVEVTSPVDAPDTVPLTVAMITGATHVPLATIALPAQSPEAPPSSTPAPIARAPRPPRREQAVQSALGDLAWPSLLALRDERRGGLGAWAYAAIADDGATPQVRVGGGASAEVPEVPLRFSLATAGDPLDAPQPVDRRGHLDLQVGLGALLADGPIASVAIDATFFLPTRAEPESLGRVRLAPSIEISVRPASWLALRTRQGALVDGQDRGARLWATALGADWTPERWLALGVELDGAVGAFVDRQGAALTLGGGIEAHVAGLQLGLAARAALTDEARALAGAWSAILSVRLFSP